MIGINKATRKPTRKVDLQFTRRLLSARAVAISLQAHQIAKTARKMKVISGTEWET
jgi:hypothetical protein